MRLMYSGLNHLPVKTESGHHLGKVTDLELDNEQHRVIKYIVKPGLLQQELLIDPTQVIAITKDGMTVEDELLREPVLAPTT